MSSSVYDPLHSSAAPNYYYRRQGGGGGRRAAGFRADPTTATYGPCKLKPIKPGDVGYASMDACTTSTVCLGPAYNYTCPATEGGAPQLLYTQNGKTKAENLMCYGCSTFGTEGVHAVDSADPGTCVFTASSPGTNGYATIDDCQSNPTQMCGWQYSCTS